tara:strand:+ start:2457 stop:3203 length:747 start_codon:yes stop_codon:yes gene_type:complete
MAIITTNGTLGATAVITNTTLNDIANAATFVSGAVDGDSLELIADGTVDDGKLGIKDAGVTTAKVADSTDKTDGVTLPKIQHIDTAKVLGRTSADEGNVEEVAVVIGGTGDAGVLFDNDDMLDNSDTAGGSATRGATQQSIKAYVDTTAEGSSNFTTESTQSAGYQVFASGLKIAWGKASDSTTAPANIVTFPTGVNFTVAPTVTVTPNEMINPSTYYSDGVHSVTTTQFTQSGYPYAIGYRYMAIGH